MTRFINNKTKMFRRIAISLITVAITFAYIPFSENVYAVTPGSSFEAAMPITSSGPIEGTLSGGPYYYKFLKNSGSITLMITAVSGSKTVSLYDENYSFIGSCSATAISTEKTQRYFILGGSWYYIKVSGSSGDYMVAYSWTNGNETVPESYEDKHDTFGDSADYTLGRLYKDQLGFKDKTDAFTFDVPHDGTITVGKFFSSGATSLITGQFYDMNGRPEGTSFSATSNSDDIYSLEIPKGRHYVIFSGGPGMYYFGLSHTPIHDYGEWNVVENGTCTKEGKKERTCSECGQTETQAIPINPSAHVWDNGTITKEATTTEEGCKTYTCLLCGETKAEVISKKPDSQPQPSPFTIGQMGEDGTPVGRGASANAAEAAITNMSSDNDLEGAEFSKLKLRSPKQAKKIISLRWNKVNNAASYVIYGNKCGIGNKPVMIARLVDDDFEIIQINGRWIKKGTYYKFIVVALDNNNKVISTSKLIHVATKGGKVGNHKKVTVKKSVITKAKKLKVGKSLKLKAKPVKAKLTVKKHRAVAYESSNPAVATVSKKGVVKGKSKGSCYIYAYAQNGIYKRIKVVVR